MNGCKLEKSSHTELPAFNMLGDFQLNGSGADFQFGVSLVQRCILNLLTVLSFLFAHSLSSLFQVRPV